MFIFIAYSSVLSFKYYMICPKLKLLHICVTYWLYFVIKANWLNNFFKISICY